MKHRKGPRHDGNTIHGVCASCGRVGRIDPETLLCLDCLRDPVKALEGVEAYHA
jgi:hypothetical protein